MAAGGQTSRQHRREPAAAKATVAPDPHHPCLRLSAGRGWTANLTLPKPITDQHQAFAGRSTRGTASAAAGRPNSLGRRLLLCPFLDVYRRIDDSFAATSLHRATSTTRGVRRPISSLSSPILWPTPRRCSLLDGARLYIIDPETDQSTSVPGNALRTDPSPSRCARELGRDHVSRRAPQQLGGCV